MFTGKLLRLKSRSAPWIPVGLILALLPLRWIFIAGLGDFPNDLIFAFPLWKGLRQGVDFGYVYSTALPFYLPAFWLWLFSGHFIGLNLNIWLLWLINSLAGGWITRKAGGTAAEAAFSVLATGLLFVPPDMNMVSWHFLASVLSTFAVGFFLVSCKENQRRWMLASGVLCGLNSMVKPNFGIGTLGGIWIASVVFFVFYRRSLNLFLWISAALIGGFLAGWGIPWGILGYLGGYKEVFVEGFLAAGQSKGTPFLWLLRALPRISLVLDPSLKYLAEAIIAVPLFFIFFWIFLSWWVRSCQGARAESGPFEKKYAWESWVLVLPALVLSVWSLWPAEFPARLNVLFRGLGMISLPEFNNHLLYVLVFALLSAHLFCWAWDLVRGGSQRIRGLPAENCIAFSLAGISLVLLMSNGASGRYGAPYSASLFVPVIVLTCRGNYKEIRRWALVGFLVFWTASWHLAPSWHSTFGRLRKLPDSSIFSGMYHPDNAATAPGSSLAFMSTDVLYELQMNLPQRISGRSTLWIGLSFAGAFGEKPYRYGLFPMIPGHIERNEARMAASLKTKPPDYIIFFSDPYLWDNQPQYSRPDSFFLSKNFQPWLSSHYTRVWSSKKSQRPFILWGRSDRISDKLSLQ